MRSSTVVAIELGQLVQDRVHDERGHVVGTLVDERALERPADGRAGGGDDDGFGHGGLLESGGGERGYARSATCPAGQSMRRSSVAVAGAVLHVLTGADADHAARAPRRRGAAWPGRRAPSPGSGPPCRSARARPRRRAPRRARSRRCSTIEPDPTSAPFSIVQHSMCTRWPITQSSPMTVGWSSVVWITLPSWMRRAGTDGDASRSRPGAPPAARPWTPGRCATSPITVASGCTNAVRVDLRDEVTERVDGHRAERT